MNLLNILTLLTLKVIFGDNPTRLATILNIFNSKLLRSILTETRILLSQLSVDLKKTLSQLIHQRFGHVSINQLKLMARKGLLEGLPENLPELEEPCPICLSTNATKITRGPTTDVSKFTPGFMLQMDLAFFNVESIRGFTSTFVAICSSTSYPIGFPSRIKRPLLDILKFLVTTLRYQDKKFEDVKRWTLTSGW